jgi:hypothetical protein
MASVTQTGSYTDTRREGTGKAPWGANLDPDLNSSDIQDDISGIIAELNVSQKTDEIPSLTSTSTRSGAGAVAITAAIAELTSTGTNAWTLADGAEGQHLFLIMVTDGGVGTLTPSNAGGWTTLAFSDPGDSAHLMFTNGKWYLVGQGGLTTGPLTA